ncbi:MAG: GTPase-like protein [Candidatus Bathyarchaeota archaeon B23]|nr:MAG: GTPase-like protein [Candidatus Bathyarchaeota archaeon B23]
MPRRVVILGAAGRDFHYFRDNPDYEVVAFTAAQLPNIAGRTYPPELAGERYPDGIPILPEEELPRLMEEKTIELAVLSYSDLLYEEVMQEASRVLAAGVDFMLLGPKSTMLESRLPVISVCAVRTGAGKSTVTRRVLRILRSKGLKPVAIRHPMPYGDLAKQAVQRFGSLEDLERYECTIEEREEYEPLIRLEVPLYAGVDYERILRGAETEGDIIVWDGGNNDLPFYKPDLHIVVADPLRPGHELRSYPGTVNAMMADVFIVNKVNVAEREAVETVKRNLRRLNPKAPLIEAESVVSVDKPELVEGRRVLVVEDGPTVTHGGLGYAAGYVAAREYGAAEIVDPRPYAVGTLREVYKAYGQLREVLPSMGYGREQMRELEESINAVECDTIVLGTPSHLERFLRLNKPVVHVTFELRELIKPDLEDILANFLKGA